MIFSCILTKVKSVLDNHFVYSYGKEFLQYYLVTYKKISSVYWIFIVVVLDESFQLY